MEAIAFIDLLGFSQMVNRDFNHSKSILSDFYNISFQIIKQESMVKGSMFSDSLLAYSSDPAKLVNVITKIYRECLYKNNTYQYDLSKFFLLLRGGISFGIAHIQKRIEAPNLSKNFIVGPALIHSNKMENQIKGSRLLIADSKNAKEQVFNWNNFVESILYENSNFTFWKEYKYFDALWFLDLSKDYESQKIEVSELINISIKLVNANSNNSEVIEQHLQTLRIGLLSFTKFLTPNSNPILTRIINEFKDDKFWLIWLTIFEIIMQSPDNWAFTSKPEIIDFYRTISLKSAWSNVIKEINKPKNGYLKNLLKRFVDELSIRQIKQLGGESPTL